MIESQLKKWFITLCPTNDSLKEPRADYDRNKKPTFYDTNIYRYLLVTFIIYGKFEFTCGHGDLAELAPKSADCNITMMSQKALPLAATSWWCQHRTEVLLSQVRLSTCIPFKWCDQQGEEAREVQELLGCGYLHSSPSMSWSAARKHTWNLIALKLLSCSCLCAFSLSISWTGCKKECRQTQLRGPEFLGFTCLFSHWLGDQCQEGAWPRE